MYAKLGGFVLSSFFACALAGQNPATENLDRVLRFVYVQSDPDIQSMLVVIRGITEVRQADQLTGQAAIAVRGRPDQIQLAEWITKELDKPASFQTPTSQNQNLESHAYRLSGNAEDIVRVFYVRHAQTPSQLNELATVIRSTGEMRRFLTYNPQRALVLRGPADQIAMAEWLVNKLDTGVQSESRTAQSVDKSHYQRSSVDDIVRVFYPQRLESVENLNELATLMRSIGEMRRLFMITTPRAIVVRGPGQQVALAEWLFTELDQPPYPSPKEQSPGTHEYIISGGADDIVGVFYLTHAATPQAVRETATQVRSLGQNPRVFTLDPQRTIAVRGTRNQIAFAQGLIQERDR